MENSPRAKMPVSQRAKQFLPFAAVKGLEEALERKEQETEAELENEYTLDESEEIDAR